MIYRLWYDSNPRQNSNVLTAQPRAYIFLRNVMLLTNISVLQIYFELTTGSIKCQLLIQHNNDHYRRIAGSEINTAVTWNEKGYSPLVSLCHTYFIPRGENS